MSRYIYRVLCALSILINTIFGGAYAQTLSARMAIASMDSRICRVICNILDFLDPGHSFEAMLFDSYIRDAVRRAKRAFQCDPHVS